MGICGKLNKCGKKKRKQRTKSVKKIRNKKLKKRSIKKETGYPQGNRTVIHRVIKSI